MRRSVAESLAVRRGQGEDGADQVEEETVDHTQQVANDGRPKCQMQPALTYDVDADHALAECRPGCSFAQDVVAEAEREEEQERFPAKVDYCVRGPVSGLGVAAARQQPDDDPRRKEDDDGVEKNGDEAERDARVFHRAPLLPCSTHARKCRIYRRRRIAQLHSRFHGRGDFVRLPAGHAGLARQQVRQIRVVPALYRCGDRPSLSVEAVRRDCPALLIDENLDFADGRTEGLPHSEPLAAGLFIVVIVVTIGTAVPGPKTPFGKGRSRAPAYESPTLLVRI